MIKSIFSVVIAAFIFSACSSAGQMQSNDSDSERSNATTEDVVAPWYDHNEKAFSDSTTFVGLGMAIAADSTEALENSMTQAREYLEYAIDSYAEDVRRQVVENSGNSEFGSGSFILSLRSAINGLQFDENDLSQTVEYEINENNAVIAYTRLIVSKDMAIDKLASVIDNSSFSTSLRETSSM